MNRFFLLCFVRFLISEECEGCTECDPSASSSSSLGCYVEGRAKWYLCKIDEFLNL